MGRNMSTNLVSSIIQSILAKIANGDTIGITYDLARLPLGGLPNNQSEKLLTYFLNQSVKSNNTSAVRAVISEFDLKRIHIDPLPAIVNIFLNPLLTREVLLFATACFPEKLPVDYFADLVNMRNDDEALKVACILNTVLPELAGEDWNLLYRMTDDTEDEEYRNQMLRAFFQTKSAETGNFAQKPEWVREYPVLPLQDIPHDIPSVKDAVDLLLSDFKRKKVSIRSSDNNQLDIDSGNEVRDTLISQYGISTIREKIMMLGVRWKNSQFDDTALFREFGPVNTQYTFHPDNNHTSICYKYGGCRMFLCTEFESIDQDGEDIDIMSIEEHLGISDWFRKSCDKCLKRIANRHYAIRQPLCQGGWRGCYCSFSCMEQDINDDRQVSIMTGRIKEQLDVIGIRDR